MPSKRRPGQEWLNGPLVWAIDEWHQPLYLFPRGCPRVLIWVGDRTSEEDRCRWWGTRDCRMIAHIEWLGWAELTRAQLFRYELSMDRFEPLNDAGMFVSRVPVVPVGMERVTNLPGALEQCEVELRVMRSMTPLMPLWSTSLHASGIRLSNSRDWPHEASG